MDPARVSDAQWSVIEPFMPWNQPRPERSDDRRITQGIVPVIPGPRAHKRKIPRDGRRSRERIEATFCRMEDFRRIATRCDKLARTSASAVALTAVIVFLC